MNCKSLLTLTIAIFIFLTCQSQYSQAYQAMGAGIGGIETKGQGFSSMAYNPAFIADAKNLVMVSNYENCYLSLVSSQSVSLAMPVLNLPIGASYLNYGIKNYQYQLFSFFSGKNLGEKLTLGIRMNYHQLTIPNYFTANAFTADLVVLIHAMDDIDLMLMTKNPNESMMNGERLPAAVKTSIRKLFANELLVAIEAEQQSHQNTIIKGGLEKVVFNDVYLRCGFSAKPSRMSFGLGYQFKNAMLDIAFMSHPVLGYSPHATLAYRITNRK